MSDGLTIEQQRDLIRHATALSIACTLFTIDPVRAAKDTDVNGQLTRHIEGLRDLVSSIPDDSAIWAQSTESEDVR